MKGKRKAKRARGGARQGIRKGPRGDAAIVRTRELLHCKEYRVWVNDSGAARQRSVSVFPAEGDFPPGTVTVFVAAATHQGGPPNPANATAVKPEGDSIGKTVPNDGAVFVHFNSTPGRVTKAVIDDGPI